MTLSTFTLLIVEDVPANRELYRHCLQTDPACDYQVLEAESVSAGLELCRTRSIDAILLDYALPDGDGLEFLETLAVQSDRHSPSVVMLTGHGNESVAVQAMKLGAQDYLAKHKFTPELLRSTIRSASENARLRLQLQQREDRFQASVANMLECFGLYSAIRDRSGQICDFRFDYLNAAALQSNNMTTADLARGLCDVFPAIRQTGLFADYCQVVETGTPLVKEDLTYSDVFGGKRLTRAYNIQIGKLDDGFVASWQDITAQKQVDVARIEAEQERDRFFNLSIDMLAIGNFDGYFTRLNPAWERTLGFTIAELMARPYLDFVHPHDRALTSAIAQELIAGEGAVSFENRYLCKDGSYRWLLWSAIPYLEQQLVYAIAHDITERQRAERDLQESQDSLKTGLKVAGVGLARFDYTTNLVELSPEAAVLYGFAPDIAFVTREQFHATFHPDERVALEGTIAQLLDPVGTGWFDRDHRVVWPCGTIRCLSVRKQVFFASDRLPLGTTAALAMDDRFEPLARPSHAILATLDVTDRNQTLADLEQRNQELDSFVYIVSHDLKAPLRAVSNLSQWIEEDLAGALTTANQEQMTTLRSRVHRMEATIGGLLDYARIGRTNEHDEPVAVAQLLAETIDTLAPPPKFTIAIAPNLPTLQTKRILLSQVFTNLISNAIRHHDRVDGMIHVGIAERGNYYEFAIADDGPGIAPEQHERIFKIFQAVNPQKRTDSTGIGLAIVKKIVEAEGGTIRLESQLGQGTTFYFTWPKAVDRG
jgi:PAS domain S-box-containing protein